MLESITFDTYPNIILNLTDGTQYQGFLNDHGRRKMDLMKEFPEAEIQFPYCVLRSNGQEVAVYLEDM